MYLLTPVRGLHAGGMIVQRPTYHIASFAVAALLAKCLPRIQARVESWSRGVQLHCKKERDISIVPSKQDTIEALDDFGSSLRHGDDHCKGAQKEAVFLQAC